MTNTVLGSLSLLLGLFFAMGFGIEAAKETGAVWPIFISLFFTVVGAITLRLEK